jgi:hypothetical protein
MGYAETRRLGLLLSLEESRLRTKTPNLYKKMDFVKIHQRDSLILEELKQRISFFYQSRKTTPLHQRVLSSLPSQLECL